MSSLLTKALIAAALGRDLDRLPDHDKSYQQIAGCKAGDNGERQPLL